MRFDGFVEKIIDLDDAELERAWAIAQQVKDEQYNYKGTTASGDPLWWRSSDKGGQLFSSLIAKVRDVPLLKDTTLIVSCLSKIFPRRSLKFHSDWNMYHKLSYHILIPLNKDLSYSFSWRAGKNIERRSISYGAAWHLNNVAWHTAHNENDADRYLLILDLCDQRLYHKFQDEMMQRVWIATKGKFTYVH